MIPANLTTAELRDSKHELLEQFCNLLLEQKKMICKPRKIRRVKLLEKQISEITDDIDLVDEQLKQSDYDKN